MSANPYVTQNSNHGGELSAPNRAPAAKVIAGALANSRVAQALIAALGGWSIANAIVASGVSPSAPAFAGLKVGDYVIHIPSSPGNVQAAIVVTAGVCPMTPISGDLYLDLQAVNLDSNNPIIGSSLNDRSTGDAGLEF